MEKFPLQWPVGYPRTKYPMEARFGSITFERSRQKLFRELEKMLDYNDRKTIVLSTDLPLRNDGMPYASAKANDKGVAVYFNRKGEQMVLCCDKWKKMEHNIHAICKTVEAMRGIDRWGVSDFLKRSFQGFNALPPAAHDKPKRKWWVVFEYPVMPDFIGEWPRIEAQYKSLAKKRHPDAGGTTEAFQELVSAFVEAKKLFGK